MERNFRKEIYEEFRYILQKGYPLFQEFGKMLFLSPMELSAIQTCFSSANGKRPKCRSKI